MNTHAIENDSTLQQVLWACYSYWQTELNPANERGICYNWVLGPYVKRFGSVFHQSALGRLAKLGFLEPEEVTRAGRRRYYKIPDPDQVESLLKKWELC